MSLTRTVTQTSVYPRVFLLWRYRTSNLHEFHVSLERTYKRTSIPSTSYLQLPNFDRIHLHVNFQTNVNFLLRRHLKPRGIATIPRYLPLSTIITNTTSLYSIYLSYSSSPASQVSDIYVLFTLLFLFIPLPSKLIVPLYHYQKLPYSCSQILP